MATATTILLLVVFDNLLDAKGHRDLTGLPGSQFDAALAGSLLSAILIILLQLVSFFVLLRSTTWAATKPAGASLPFVSASFLHVALFLLLTGMILTSNTHWEDQLTIGGWSSGDSSAMKAAYWLCFFTTGIYLIMCSALLLLQRAQSGRTVAFPIDLETSLASQNLRVAAAPMSDSSDVPPGPSYRTSRADTAVPSDYAESVAAARKQYGGAWGR